MSVKSESEYESDVFTALASLEFSNSRPTLESEAEATASESDLKEGFCCSAELVDM